MKNFLLILTVFLFPFVCFAWLNTDHILYDNFNYRLNNQFEPINLVHFYEYWIKSSDTHNKDETRGRKIIMNDLKNLINKCEKESNMNIYIRSWYRSYYLQSITYQNYGKEYSALPGTSEHQLWLAIDIETRKTRRKYFLDNNNLAYKCFEDHAYKYWFIQSYKKNNPYWYKPEPWHWRYIGKRASYWLKTNNNLDNPWIIFEEKNHKILTKSRKELKRINRIKKWLKIARKERLLERKYAKETNKNSKRIKTLEKVKLKIQKEKSKWKASFFSL